MIVYCTYQLSNVRFHIIFHSKQLSNYVLISTGQRMIALIPQYAQSYLFKPYRYFRFCIIVTFLFTVSGLRLPVLSLTTSRIHKYANKENSWFLTKIAKFWPREINAFYSIRKYNMFKEKVTLYILFYNNCCLIPLKQTSTKLPSSLTYMYIALWKTNSGGIRVLWTHF